MLLLILTSAVGKCAYGAILRPILWPDISNHYVLFTYCAEKSTFNTSTLLLNICSEKTLFPKGPLWKKFVGFTYSRSNVMPASQFFPSQINGQNAADCHFGTKRIPTALHFLAWKSTWEIRRGGGTNHKFSLPQSYENAFTPLVSLHQYLE